VFLSLEGTLVNVLSFTMLAFFPNSRIHFGLAMFRPARINSLHPGPKGLGEHARRLLLGSRVFLSLEGTLVNVLSFTKVQNALKLFFPTVASTSDWQCFARLE
jgi:hypothetical protein